MKRKMVKIVEKSNIKKGRNYMKMKTKTNKKKVC